MIVRFASNLPLLADAAVATTPAEELVMTPAGVALALLSLFMIGCFVASFIMWGRLLWAGRRPLGDSALVPMRPRARPFWTAFDFVVFYGVLLVATITLMGVFQSAGWIAKPITNSMVDAGGETAAPSISIGQLAVSSLGTLLAMLGTIGLLRLRAGNVSAKLGLVPTASLVGLGFLSALLVLPPTMLMMGAVSRLQEYSHPVLEALKTNGAGGGPDWPVFAMLFVSTAVLAPVIEEFWFRGLLQGGLQRLADPVGRAGEPMPSPDESLTDDAVTDDAVTGKRPVELPVEHGDPYAVAAPQTIVSAAEIDDSPTNASWQPVAIWPIFATSVVFAAMHAGQGLAPIPLFFLSVALGYLYRQTGSLVPSIVVHFLLNGLTMVVTLLQMLQPPA